MEIGARDLSRDAAKIARYEKDMELVIRELESIHSLVVYVPGNVREWAGVGFHFSLLILGGAFLKARSHNDI